MKVALLSEWHVHAQQYADELNAMEEVTLSVVWDNDVERGQKWAEKMGLPFEADLDKVLAMPEIDAVAITTQTNLHKDIMIKAAKAKKHIFTEKVMAFTQAECEEIIAAIKENDIIFTISFVYKPRALFIKLKEMLDEGVIGDITYGRMRNCHSGSSDGWLPDHFYDAEVCGGGAMMDLGAHPMYLLNWYMGNPTKMTCIFNSVTGKPVEDNAVALIEFENKAIGVSETSFVACEAQQVVEMTGTKGTIIANYTHGFIEYKTKGMDNWEKITEFAPDLPTPLRQWVLSVENNEPVRYGVEDALNLTKFMEICYESHNTQKIVTVK